MGCAARAAVEGEALLQTSRSVHVPLGQQAMVIFNAVEACVGSDGRDFLRDATIAIRTQRYGPLHRAMGHPDAMRGEICGELLAQILGMESSTDWACVVAGKILSQGGGEFGPSQQRQLGESR